MNALDTQDTRPDRKDAAPGTSVPKKRGRMKRAVAASLLGGLVFGFLGGGLASVAFPYVWNEVREDSSRQDALPAAVERERLVAEDAAVVQTVEQASPGVVSVVISRDVPRLRNFYRTPFGFPFFFFEGQEGGASEGGTRRQTVGQGSGFVVSPDGMIVTNKHVVQDEGADYTVIANDGKEYPARVLARDPGNDIAVLKVDAADLHVLALGDSNSLKVGQTVVAIGNSLGEFSNTVSKGIVSGLRRNVTAGSGQGDTERLRDIIQTDAAINPGNSGGPLLDVSGKVIGVNVAMAQGAENIGFALPIDQVKRIIDQVKATGRISAPFLGVRYAVLDEDVQKEASLPFDYGAWIVRGERMIDAAVIPGSPADKAGLAENDIILEMDGRRIDRDYQIADALSGRRAGDEVVLKVWHKGETRDVRVRLEERR
jgi:serine protease Do